MIPIAVSIQRKYNVMEYFIKVRGTFLLPIWSNCVVSQTADNFEIDNFEIHKSI